MDTINTARQVTQVIDQDIKQLQQLRDQCVGMDATQIMEIASDPAFTKAYQPLVALQTTLPQALKVAQKFGPHKTSRR